MKLLIRLKYCTLAAILVGFTGIASAEESVSGPTADDVSQAQFLADLAALEADRFGAIEGIKAIWGDNEDFVGALNGANDEQLIDIQNASSFDEVRAILQGRESVLDLDGIIGTETLGDRTRDLVFTPVVPCRIVDTRFDNVLGAGHNTGAGGANGTSRSYLVHGSAASLVHQGHTANTGCFAPRGEPSGIHANFTAVPFSGSGGGNIRAFPVGGALPTVSLVNYRAGINIANAASVATRFLSSGSDDIWVTATFLGSDQVVDVMGYYYPTSKLPPSQTSSGGNPVTTGVCTNIASIGLGSNARGYWDVTAHVKAHILTNTGLEIMRFYLSTVSANCSGNVAVYEEWEAAAHSSNTVSLQNRFFVSSAQSEVIYLNMSGTSDIGIEHMSSQGETIHAVFHPLQ